MPVPSEREKMLAGESYNIFDRDLVALRKRTKRLLRLFNLTEEDELERQTILQQSPARGWRAERHV